MVNAVIFDMDGVLVNSESFYKNRRRNFFKRQNITYNEDIDLTGSNEEEIWRKLIPNDEILREKTKKLYKHYREKYTAPYKELFNPDAKQLLEKLKKHGVAVAIASSSNRNIIEDMIEQNDITDYIDFYISGSECTEYKPNPEIYLTVIQKMNLDVNKTLVVEDSTYGIRAALDANLKVCALKPLNGENIDQEEATYKIDNIIDVLDVIDKHNDISSKENFEIEI